jgi:hypothetical protein
MKKFIRLKKLIKAIRDYSDRVEITRENFYEKEQAYYRNMDKYNRLRNILKYNGYKLDAFLKGGRNLYAVIYYPPGSHPNDMSIYPPRMILDTIEEVDTT